ncbi:MAG: hypothetical protein HFF64_02735 [Oscillospiraceae bacterium]|nr:hypothetical protein [Oscillospiraceae bacterium]
MNIMDTLLLQQMQQMAAGMTALPQTGSKDKSGASSFQDLMDQINRDTSAASKETKDSKDASGKPVKDQEKTEETLEEGAPVQTEEQEELRPQDMVANPNVVNFVEFFQPEAALAVEESVITVPVEAIPEESVEGAGMELDGQLPMLDTAVETSVEMETPMEQNTGSFQEAMAEEIPQEQAAPVENAAEAAPVQETEQAEKPRQEVEVEAVVTQEEGDEPKGEAAEAPEAVFHDAKAAPVKVGERYETVDTQAPNMDEQVAAAVRQAVQAGSQRIEIRLTPENLGELVIEMTRDAGGALQVVLHASTSRAAGLLTEHLTGLHAALQAQSAQAVHVEVQRGQESQQQNLHQQTDPNGHHQQHRQQERRQEQTGGEDFLQKLRLGLFGEPEEA